MNAPGQPGLAAAEPLPRGNAGEGERASPTVRAEEASDVLQLLRERPGAFDLFQAMRRIEAAHPHLPLLGDAVRPTDEPFRFAQDAALDFAASAISRIEDRPGVPPRVVQRVFGFLGPNGALPLHLTEYARDRQLHHNDETFLRFLDLLLHRFGLLFYKAWARAQPAISLDRRDSALVRQLSGLLGIRESALRNADELGDFPKLDFAGRLARSVRDADGLEAWLSLRLRVSVRVVQFVGHWMTLERKERSRLAGDGQSALGRNVVIGGSVWDLQHKFRIVIGPLDWVSYRDLLPGTTSLGRIRAMVRQYVGFEFAWDVQLILKRDQVPSCPLGKDKAQGIGRVGRSSWIHGGATYRRERDAADLVMNVESILR